MILTEAELRQLEQAIFAPDSDELEDLLVLMEEGQVDTGDVVLHVEQEVTISVELPADAELDFDRAPS